MRLPTMSDNCPTQRQHHRYSGGCGTGQPSAAVPGPILSRLHGSAGQPDDQGGRLAWDDHRCDLTRSAVLVQPVSSAVNLAGSPSATFAATNSHCRSEPTIIFNPPFAVLPSGARLAQSGA